MKFRIVHELSGRIRLRCGAEYFSREMERSIENHILKNSYVHTVKASSVNGGILITYEPEHRSELLECVKAIKACDLELIPYEKNPILKEFKKRLIKMAIMRFAGRLIFPSPIRTLMAYIKAFPFIKEAFKSICNFRADVALLDGAAVAAALAQRMYSEVNSIIFLLKISELLEEYTRRSTKDALAKSLAVQVDKVWRVTDGKNELVPIIDIKKDDLVVFRDGCMIAVDGMVTDGIATVNEASMTGEPLAAEKKEGAMVYAGTVIEEGSITVRVVNTTKDTRISHIIEMIENGENLKASVQSRAEKMADKMVPYSLGLAALVYILTRNVTKAMSVLMVDYSCAIKLATPISVISSMREASTRGFVIKGGKHLESFAHADTILFDKTGTLTNACPVVEKVIPFGGYDADAVLRTAACLEEHFPHSVAKAVVKAALDKGLHHEEEHAEVEYVVAHGIVTTLHGKRAIIGSEHFVIEDEGVTLTVEEKSIIEKESEGYTAIYLAYAGKIAGVICISDPPRDEAKEAVELLKASGIENVIMLTGDHESAAKRIADMTGITEFNAQVLPEDKARVVSELKEKGHTVIMVGDGINDSPALALADVSVAMKDSSDLAREVADITLLSGDLRDLAILRTLSEKLFARIKGNYRFIAGFNSALILSGLMGLITPSLSSLMHNASTMLISAHSMTPLLKEKN